VASDFGGRVQPGSGCFSHRKGDVDSEEFLIECKRTDAKSISLKLSWLHKIEREAAEEGKEGLLLLDIDGHEYVVLRKDLMLCLCGEEK